MQVVILVKASTESEAEQAPGAGMRQMLEKWGAELELRPLYEMEDASKMLVK